jgi:hypothetical protein
VRSDYYELIRKTSAANGLELQVFNSMEEALEWMRTSAS